MALDRCDSCGSDGAGAGDLINVQRVYLITASEGTIGADQMRVLDDIELWCFVCRSMYPHAGVETE